MDSELTANRPQPARTKLTKTVLVLRYVAPLNAMKNMKHTCTVTEIKRRGKFVRQVRWRDEECHVHRRFFPSQAQADSQAALIDRQSVAPRSVMRSKQLMLHYVNALRQITYRFVNEQEPGQEQLMTSVKSSIGSPRKSNHE
jgi:hypothetical protein